MTETIKKMLKSGEMKEYGQFAGEPAGYCIIEGNELDVWAYRINELFLSMIHTAGKPIIPITFREVSDYARRYYRDHGTYFIDHVEDGFKAVSHLIRYAQFQRRLHNN